MEQTAALLGSAAIKTRLAGVTELLELLKRSDGEDGGEVALIPHVLPCLRDHNAKITQSALEICELLVQRTPEATVRSYFKLLWAGVVERLGDSKLPVRQKAVDVVLSLAETLDVDTILEKLKLCTAHKNWRTREQALYALWRCLEAYDLVISRKSEALDDALRLLEDPSKEVREAAIQTLEKFYAYVGPALVRELEAKNIRTAQMKMLSDRFQSVSVRSSAPQNAYDSAKVFTSDTSGQAGAQKDALTSILSSYDLQVDSSSSMARYLASVRSRTMNEAKSAAAEVERSPSQSSTTSNTSVADRSSGTLGDSSGSVSISDKDVQKQIATIYDQLEIKNDWTKRVEGLKAIQSLALQCASKDPTPALTALSVGVRTVRERLGEQVNDLRSSVSREACHTIHVIASVLRDDFSQHAEFFMGSLLKATYVTIQVISTSADKSIRGVINCTTNGYARIIPKFMDGARSRNQVLKTNCVAYLTLTLEQWSTTFLSKHTDVFVPNLPALLQDAVGEVRAQARKCYWAFHHLFPAEANGIFNRLDASTQRNLREDPARVGSESARKLRQSANDTAPVVERSNGASIRSRFTKGVRYALAESSETTTAPATAQRVLQTSGSESAKSSVSSFGPRRVLGPSGSGSTDDSMDGRSTRMLSQGPRRIEREMRVKTSEDGPDPAKRTGLGAGPLRVLSTPKASVSKVPTDSAFNNLPDVPKPQRIHVGDPKKLQSESSDGPPSDRPRRLVRAASGSSFDEASPRNHPRSSGSDGTAGSVDSKVTPASFSVRQSSKLLHDRVEDSLLNLEHSSWSIRVEAVESIGKFIMMQLQNAKRAGNASTSDTNVDERILSAFVKHMNDAHYRVSQTVLGYFLPLIQLSIAQPQQLLPHLRSILSTLFQRGIETKENVRSLARENLDYIAAEMDASTLASFVVPLLNEGSNMKVKAAVCKYLQALLPRAEGYMKQGTNNNHMRSFLLKLAQLLDGEVPVSVASACSDLIGVAVQEFAPEMESVMPMLPPSKRAILGKLLKSRGINLSLVTGVTRPGSANNLHTSKQRGADNQKPEELISEDRQGERGRKRESPTANSSSPARQLQKRPNTAESGVPANPWHEDRSLGLTASSQRSPEVVINVALRALEQNNVNDSEHRRVLRRLLDVILHRFDAFSDELFERTFMGLLEATCDNDFYALRVLQQLVASGAARVEPFLDILVDRLLVTFGKHLDMSLHLVETTLTDALSASSDCQRALTLLVPFISSLEWPGLLVVLGLVRARISACAHRPDQLRAFLQQRLQRENLFGSLASLLRHQAMDVRKAAVQCLVALYFATEHDKEAMLSKYLDTELDDTRKKLVAIYIDRAKRERHHLTS